MSSVETVCRKKMQRLAPRTFLNSPRCCLWRVCVMCLCAAINAKIDLQIRYNNLAHMVDGCNRFFLNAVISFRIYTVLLIVLIDLLTCLKLYKI